MAQPMAAKSSQESSLSHSRECSPVQPAFSGLSASETEILALQQSMGNRAVSQLLEAGDATPAKDGIPPIVQSVLNSGSGRPLEPGVRAEMESRFQQDFSQVRIHTDSKAAESARAVNATAYTVKHDIAFDTGEYIPETKDGKQLLAHELAHAVQQSRGGGAPSPSPQSPLEQSADQAASAIAQGGESVQVSGSSAPGLARQAKKKSPWETFTHYVETAREVKDAAKATFSDDKNKDKGYVERAFLAADAGRNVVEEKLSPEEKKPLEPALKVANFVLGPPLASYKSAGGSDSPAAVQKPPPKETSTTKAPAASSTNKNEPLLLTSSLDLQNLSESDFFAEVERIKQWRINHKDESSFPRTHIEETVWSALMAEVSRRSHSKNLPPLHGFVDLRPYSKPPEDEQLIQEIDEATRAQPPLSAPTIQPSRIAVRLLVGGTLPPPGADSESQTTASADELIGKYSIPDSLTGNIYTDKLGADLSDLAVQGGDQNYKTVQDTFDKLDSTDKDDVALAMSSQMSDDQLELMIQNPNGRKFLHRLFDELTSGHLGEDEMAQANRILAVEQDTNLSTQTTEGQQRAAKDALVLPYRPPGFTVTPSPIYAERLENGKIRVRLRADLYGTDYRKDIFEHKIPGSVYSLEGVELDANQLVGVKLYDQGGKVVYVPALSLLTFNNQDTTKAYQMMAEAGFTGLTLGFGGVGGAVGEGAEVVEGATQASRGLQIAKNTVRGLDIAATYGTPALTAAQEHRGEVINALGEYDGKLVMGAVDTAQTGLFYYGLGRTAFGVGKRALGKSRSSTPPRSSEPKSSNLDRPKQFPKVSDEILEGQPANDFTPEAANDNAIHPDEPASMARTGTDDLGVSPNRPNLTYIQGGGAKGDQVVASAKGGGGRNVGSINPPVRSVPPPIRNVTFSNIVSRRARPPARLSEFNTQQHLEKTLPTGQWEEQVIFKDGTRAKKTRSGKNPKGSTVPDHYNAQLKLAVEDKNWDIAWSYNNLRKNILEQQGGRFENLPPGTKQWLYLDIRAQKITQVAELAKSLRRDLGGKKIFEEIRLITDKGIQIF